MSALNQLASLLLPGSELGARPVKANAVIDRVLAEMVARAKSGQWSGGPEDHQLHAVRQFWERQELSTFKDTYLLSWGLCIPHIQRGPCVLEDRSRFRLVLDGVETFRTKPSAFRRCYQGLVKSYFTYDAMHPDCNVVGQNNWNVLREYLGERTSDIRDRHLNPEWVATALENTQLFSANPCEPYVEALLRGDASTVDRLCEQLGIAKASWFMRQLVLSQVQSATKLGNQEFQSLMRRLLELIGRNEVLRDRGLTLVLNRYAKVPGTQLHQELRDAAVQSWGNPWLPSNETRWGGVDPAARSMISDWLKLEFIETFFTKLADDGLGDPRRMEFWKRYVKAIGNIEFALGSAARASREPDFIALRKEMAGLVCDLEVSGSNNAFIMTMGNLVAVEFSGMGNALYGYDARIELPFDTSLALRLAAGAKNSLKQKTKSILWMTHQDGIHNWDKWEQKFEATLKNEFDIRPGIATTRVARTVPPSRLPPATLATPSLRQQQPTATPSLEATSEWALASALTPPYSMSALLRLTRILGIQVEDLTMQGGNVWVRTTIEVSSFAKMLEGWGFRYKPNKGWWK